MADKKSTQTEKKDERTRNWTFIVYPDSAPANWRDILDGYNVPWIESPLHEFDVNPSGEGELKKPHWHCVMLFPGKKSFEQIKSITTEIKSPIPQPCANAQGAVRYMAHIDNPDKYQYPVSDIKSHGGADAMQYLKSTSSDKIRIVKEILNFCTQEDITEYSVLIEYALAERTEDWFPFLLDNCTIMLSAYFKSKHYRKYGR